ncbi:flagellar brake protein [Solimicrobium silvestre]|uniref:Flagellar brake protein YcgR n=1 Tax=Solimicrobium silvestre TaxID=2099400 RepID=A0A2S9GSU6_9BURK|nr:flagellar brake protein [Solimicrobium silvestre]PRC90775.1 Flagellar regulator YcgR [Solimicrobium silvestre]
MIPTSPVLGTENQSPYQVDSRKEIILLLRSLQENKQLINMIIHDGNEVIITAILKVDDDNNNIIFDCASTESANQRLIEAPRVYFEAALNKIGIQFSSSSVSRCNFMGSPSLCCTIPSSLIRLQRREYYRINTPHTHPLICVVNVPEENGGGKINLPLVDISCGGVAMLDDQRVLNVDFGTLYNDCKIDLPGIGLVNITLQVRNSQNLLLMNHKTSRRIGFQFIDLSKTMMAQIQKLITKIERERNSRQSGMN